MSHRPIPNLKTRLRVEELEKIEVPASLTWANLTGDGNAMNPSDYYITGTQTVATAPLQQGDNLTYDGNVSSASAAGLEGFGNAMAPAGTSPSQLSSYADYGSINRINGYAGTVTLAPDSAGQLAVMTLTVTSGTLAQQADGAESQARGQVKPQGTSGSTGGATSTDLTVYGALDWTGGTVGGPNSASVPPLAPAKVNLEGGGTIAPAGAGTVVLGSTLNVDALYGATTVTELPGTMSINASSSGEDVKAGAALQVTFQTSGANVNIVPTVTLGTQAITIAARGELSVVGPNTNPANSSFAAFVPVINSGTFALTGQVTGALKGGSANPLVYDYTQTGSASGLAIQSGSMLTTSVGSYVNGGIVLLTTNPALGAAQQVATITGYLNFEGGTIQFSPPILIGTALVYGQLSTGNVYWGGGTYNPWVNYAPVVLGGIGANSNYWVIGGTLTIPNLNGDFITPSVQNMPANGLPPANGSWDILQAKTVSNNNNAYLPTVNKDVKGNQLTLKTRVMNGFVVWSLNS